MPNSLRNSLLFAADKLKLPLSVHSVALLNICALRLARTPVPALSVSFKLLLHFAAFSEHQNFIVALYSAGLVLA